LITKVLERIEAGNNLAMDEMADVIDGVMGGGWSEEQLTRLLLGLKAKGETVEEIAGAAAALRRHMTPLRSRREGTIDTCGTGGDGSGTFNISTAAAIVAAAAGVPVAKHGNRGFTSKSGSADVLVELGVNIQAELPVVERCLNELGICFCFAPLMHPSMKHVAAVRRKLQTPTIFNLLGPLANPASAPFQLLGVGRPALRAKLAAALRLLGTRRAAVLSGADGLDEVTLSGPTDVSCVEAGECRELVWSPRDFGLSPAPLDALQVDGPAASATMIRAILAGSPGTARDIVVLNAGAAIWVAGQAASLRAGAGLAQAAIDHGAARDLLARLAKLSHA
jgi:anthranilate phosphoribosyltransferase